MALTEETVVDRIEVIEDGSLQIRIANVIKRDGTEISREYFRHVIHPSTKTGGSWGDTNISGEQQRVQNVANAVWTSDVKTNYQNKMDAQAAA
tara:strand:+ start:917 stop:1195 length:279 start_codon:yes stop_codon:yes gene_type:complete